ncbi:MAG: DUF3570 domain-containing protein [Lewinellaceae bacterium]|nr:DUF3570 domain-containing protein [Lewinellaceae bacterium]
MDIKHRIKGADQSPQVRKKRRSATACFAGMLLLAGAGRLCAQSPSDSTQQRAPIDVNFLFHYYQQDGDHSAVTGGIGTQELTDYASHLIVVIPVDTVGKLSVDAAVNTYSSASTDRIDNRVSSASSNDIRAAIQLGWEQERTSDGALFGWGMGGSVESDYLSTNIEGSWYRPFGQGQDAFFLSGQAFFDRWVLYFPQELRDTVQPLITTDRRFSYNLEFQYQRIINRRLNLALSAGLSLQDGLLSTPFHRVYFPGEGQARIEHLPGRRWKWPLGLRLNYFAGSRWVLRFAYRYYFDSFGIRAHSLDFEAPFRLTPGFSFWPIYRYHWQQASTYFAPYEGHSPDARYYTSDYDLAGLESQKFGLGLQFTPLWRLRLNPRRLGEVSQATIRIVHYRRGDGLRAWSVGTSWGLKL